MTGAVGGRKLAINLVSRDNGVGLTADMALLEGMLGAAGHDVARVDWRGPAMRRVDVAIFLELWNPRLARYAEKTVGVFNLEWFQHAWGRDLPRITQLWAKSAEAHEVYRRMRLRSSTLTGFLSRDMYDPAVPRELSCLHVRGHSDFKNTDAVIRAWRRDPHLPPLTIISAVPLEVPENVRVLGRVSDEELRAEMNRHAIHICPSRAEGWGHYITEALSAGALVVTIDASPMNEHVRPEWGVLVPPTRIGRRGMVSEYGVSARTLGEGVRQALNTPAAAREEMSKRAREHFERRNTDFADTALSLLARI